MQQKQGLEQLFRVAIRCSACFEDGHLRRSFIDVAQPRLIGKNYWTCPRKILVLMINPGKGCNDEAHRRGAERIRAFGSGLDILDEIFQSQRNDLPNWGKFMPFYSGLLSLCVDELALANVAWCSTVGDKYPASMLDECFIRHTEPLVWLLNPDVILLSGSNIHRFRTKLEHAAPKARVILAPHYAHREGLEYEQTHARRILAELGETAHPAPTAIPVAVIQGIPTSMNRPMPLDFPRDFYTRKMKRTPNGRVHEFNEGSRGKRKKIWEQWHDGDTVGHFVWLARPLGGGPGDLRIYIEKELVAFDPPLSPAERNAVQPSAQELTHLPESRPT
jgi:hypothetical protein